VRAVVTGSAGFTGSAVASALKHAGYEVTGVDTAKPFGARDVRDFARQDAGGWHLAVHCAAAAVTTAAKAAPGLPAAGNLAIDADVFSWAARTRPGRLVYFSSSCAYPVAWGKGHRLHESDIDLRVPGQPDGLYGWVKLTGEVLAQAARAAGVQVSVVRPFSVYGPGVREGFAVRGFAEQVRRKADPVEIWGDSGQVRDFIHVSDVAAAVAAIAREGIDGPVNLGTGRGTSLRALAWMMARAAGYEPRLRVNESKPAGMPSLVADNALLRSFCPPRVTLEDGVAEVLRG
jgi:UDP-glucose 4-epimerase